MSKNRSRESPLDNQPYRSFIKECIEAGDMNVTIVRKLLTEYELETSSDSILRFRKRHGVQVPAVEHAYTKITGDTAVAQTPPKGFIRNMYEKPILDDPDAMLEERGLDPSKWRISDNGIDISQWDGPQSEGNIVTYYRIKFHAVRIRPECQLLPPRSDGWQRHKISRKLSIVGEPELIVVVGDHQAPFHDRHLHSLFLQWLEFNQPQRGVNLGDLMDFPDISRHPDDPDNVAIANECLQAGYDINRSIVEASSSTRWQWLPGNHDARLRTYVIEKAPKLHGLKRVDAPGSFGEVVHDVSFLTRSDELGIEFIDPRGPYDLAQVTLGSNLAVRHGWIVRPKGGQSAYASLEKAGYSLLLGHTHRQAIVQHSVPEISGKSRQLLAAEIGCMCRVDDVRGEDDRLFPSYTPMSDWQQGFAVVSLWPDSKFNVSLASYVNKTLLWEGQRYE